MLSVNSYMFRAPMFFPQGVNKGP